MTKQINNVLTEEKRVEIKEFLNSQEASNVLMSGMDTWLSLRVFNNIIIEVQPNEILVTNNVTKDVVESYNTIDRALSEDRIFKVLESTSGSTVTISSDKKIFVRGETWDSNYIGVWTDGNTVVAIEDDLDDIIVKYFDDDRNQPISETLIIPLPSFLNSRLTDEIELDDAKLECVINDLSNMLLPFVNDLIESLEDGFVHGNLKSKILKTSIKTILDSLNLEARYIDINRVVTKLQLPGSAHMVYMAIGALITEDSGYVTIRYNDGTAKLIKIDAEDIGYNNKFTGAHIEKFFETIEANAKFN